MNRPVQTVSVLMLVFLLSILPGCSGESSDKEGGEQGSVNTVDPATASAKGGSGSDKPGHEGHDHGSTGTEGESGGPDPFNLKPILPARTPKRESIAGRWLVRVVQIVQGEDEQTPPQIGERPLLLVSITPAEGENPGSVLSLAGVESPFIGALLVDVKASGKRVEFTGTDRSGEKLFDFRGTFQNGVVIGSQGYSNGAVVPARLVPTDEKTLARIPKFDPFDEMPEFVRLQQQALIPEQTMQFAKDHPVSPLSRMACLGLLQAHLGSKRPVKEVELAIKIALDEQSAWGERCVMQTRHQILQLMNQTAYDVDYSLKYFDELEKLPAQKDPGVNGDPPDISGIRQQLFSRRAYEELQSTDPETRKKGREHAREVLKEMPYNVAVMLALADDYRVKNELDEAIRLYAEIKALPMLELLLLNAFATDPVKRITPSQRLRELWKKAGRKDDMEEYVTSIYNEKLLAFRGEPFTPDPDSKGNRVALAELFTSCNSPDSVAADLVVSALEKTIPSTKFVVLRYHQHSHVPDPLANQDSEARCYNYYRFPGAPLLLLNGENPGNITGTMSQTVSLHQQTRKFVEERLSQETPVTIGLSANRQGDSLQIQAQVDGTDATNENLRLRIALAESGIDYTGINHIRRHDMVVRAMPGGDAGIAPIDGVLKFEGDINLAVLKKELTDYLSDFEEHQAQKFPSRPLELKQLYVVAFVQDDSTRQVLQSAIVSLNPPAAE